MIESTADRALQHEHITAAVIGVFFEVYNSLGFGFLEAIYERAVEQLLVERGHRVSRQHPLTVYFRGEPIGFHRCDMVIDDLVIAEMKATESLPEVAKRQLRNYLAATRLDVGLLLHFGPKARYYRIERVRE